MEEVILVDPSAWIRHLREANPSLVRFLREGRVRTCEVVIGELLLGAGLPKGFAKDLSALPRVPTPPASVSRAFIERHARSFAASGVGWADAQIIHAVANAGVRLLTGDRAVRRVCRSVAVHLA